MKRRLGIRIAIAVGSLVWLFGAYSPPAAKGQEGEPVKFGNFETRGSTTFGYRFTEINGYEPKYLELFNLQQGPRLFDFNLYGQAPDGVSPFADSFSLHMSGLGGDPFPGGQFTLRKRGLYDLRVNYRQSQYFWNQNDSGRQPPGLLGLTSNHDWATTRRFGSVNLGVKASERLRFNFEYFRTTRNGVNFTTRTIYFTNAPSFPYFLPVGANHPYPVVAPIDDVSNRFTGGVSYTLRDWNFHYRLGYQSFKQLIKVNTQGFPVLSIAEDTFGFQNEPLDSFDWTESRKLKTPVSEFSFTGKANPRLSLRGGYIYYRYRGPSLINAQYSGTGRESFGPTPVSAYDVSISSSSKNTEPNHVADFGFSYKLKPWWTVHSDYRYSRFSMSAVGVMNAVWNTVPVGPFQIGQDWDVGMHVTDLNFEFMPLPNLIIRPGIRYMKRDVIGRHVESDGTIETEPELTRRIKTVWPTATVFYRPSKKLNIRASVRSITNGQSYTRISAHTDVGARIVVRYRPTKQFSLQNSLVARNRDFQETGFKNNFRSNTTTFSYRFDKNLTIHGGFGYDSYFATASVVFLRGTPPLEAVWRDQTVSRLWLAGISAKPMKRLGIEFTGHFIRTTGAGEISGEPPKFGPLTWPLATGRLYYDVPRLGRFSIELQRSYYLEEIVRVNDFSSNLLTISLTRDF